VMLVREPAAGASEAGLDLVENQQQVLLVAPAPDDFEVARRRGMRNLREDGWLKVRDGVSTAEEVMRVTQEF